MFDLIRQAIAFVNSPPATPLLVGQWVFCDWIGFSATASELDAARGLPGVSCGVLWDGGVLCIVMSDRYGTVGVSDCDVICPVKMALGRLGRGATSSSFGRAVQRVGSTIMGGVWT